MPNGLNKSSMRRRVIAEIHDPKNVYGLLNDQGFDPVYGVLNRVMIDELTRGLCGR